MTVKGYAIGFDAKDLIKNAARPLKVSYNEKQQIKELRVIIKAIYAAESVSDIKFGSDFNRVCYSMAYDLAAYKNPAFIEEREVRLIHLLDLKRSNDFLKLKDAGGHGYGKDKSPEKIQFRVYHNGIIPFIDIDFTNNGEINPIMEVIIGPKNNMRTTAIKVFLETINVGSVAVRKSTASYR